MTGKILIVGGGVAGLSAGIRGLLRGYECEIFEKNAVPGGNLTGWERQGFLIDNCTHWLTGTRPGTKLYETWKTLGALDDGVTVYQPDRFYTSEWNGQSISLWRDVEKTRRDLDALDVCAGDVRVFGAFLDAAEAGIARGEITPGALFRYGPVTLGDLASRLSHPLLRAVLTDYIAAPFSAAALLCAWIAVATGNGGVPLGGSRAMAERMADRFVSLGGTLRLGSAVSRILVENGRACGVVLDGGEVFRGDAVIAACDPALTFGKLLEGVRDKGSRGEDAKPAKPRRLRAMEARPDAFPVWSAVQTAFGFPLEEGEHPPIGNRILPIGAPLPFRSAVDPHRLVLRGYGYDPAMAPHGYGLIQTLTPVDRDEADRFLTLCERDAHGYAAEKEKIARAIRDRIEETLPELSGRLFLLDVWTPATYQSFTGGRSGAFMSFGLTGRALPIRSLPRARGIRGLVLATQWLQPPGGLPIAARAGERAILDREIRRMPCPAGCRKSSWLKPTAF